ncbi:hypothetical protein SARC_00714 [Sphaeroforma arctica JP610]|uniref:Protein kinase domain-containing protein n=1 Tax=Sphaeroforma arctica JP610 TaxID=667725 RepID=A0A0L0GE83_9EUKA|nr:hypothetical protein SARC_00714 [Sphaeroforma arctica JP610]KNC87186.1 hypothetical protein SARC_00714 [Sphaeroforma arctica JP610]|eukprot:XP_014161088.1 hypothetical protein SARC_00714 [Sphaeroforma arctica JP610]
MATRSASGARDGAMLIRIMSEDDVEVEAIKVASPSTPRPIRLDSIDGSVESLNIGSSNNKLFASTENDVPHLLAYTSAGVVDSAPTCGDLLQARPALHRLSETSIETGTATLVDTHACENSDTDKDTEIDTRMASANNTDILDKSASKDSNTRPPALGTPSTFDLTAEEESGNNGLQYYKIGRTLGTGSHGKVKLATHTLSNVQVGQGESLH